MATTWREFGRLPALFVVGAFFATALVVSLALDAASTPLVASVFVVVILYCVAREHEGMQVFLLTVAPGAAATLADNLLGAPRWVGFLVVPFALLVVHQIDADPQPPAP